MKPDIRGIFKLEAPETGAMVVVVFTGNGVSRMPLYLSVDCEFN
jgi:hypothetical protein